MEDRKKQDISAWILFAASALGIDLVMLNISVIAAVFPEISGDFVVDDVQASWGVFSYLLLVGLVQPIASKLCMSCGLKKTFLSSIAVFAVGSLGSGITGGWEGLLAARTVQGIGGGIFLNAAMLLTHRIFTGKKLKIAMAINALCMAFGTIVAPVYGGIIQESGHWQWMFLALVPVCLLIFGLGKLLLLPDEAAVNRLVIDVRSLGEVSVTFLCFNIAVSYGQIWGWNSVEIYSLLLFGSITLLSFVWRTYHSECPLMRIDLLCRKNFLLACIVVIGLTLVQAGSIVFSRKLMRGPLNYMPEETGTLFLIPAVMTVLMIPVAIALTKKIDAKWVAIIGALCCAFASQQMTVFDMASSYEHIWTANVFRGIGIAFIAAMVNEMALRDLKPEDAPSAIMTLNTVRLLGVGVILNWLINTVAVRRQIFHYSELAEKVNLTEMAAQSAMNVWQNTFLGMGQLTEAASHKSLEVILKLVEKQAVIFAYEDIFHIMVWISLSLIVLILGVDSKSKQEKC